MESTEKVTSTPKPAEKKQNKTKKTTPRFGRGVMARNVGELRKEKRRKASQNPEIHTLLVNTRLL